MTQEQTVNELMNKWAAAHLGPDPVRDLLNQAWEAGARHAVVNEWTLVDYDQYIEEGERATEDDDPAYAAYLAEQERYCGATFVTRGSDPYATSCDQPRGHYPATAHDADSPFEGDTHRVTWMGGGSCAGDALPYTHVEWYTPVSRDPRLGNVPWNDLVHKDK
jgi:hypothetical protein